MDCPRGFTISVVEFHRALVIGLLLFLVYINDLPFSLQCSHVTMDADDTTLSHCSKKIVDISEKHNGDL